MSNPLVESCYMNKEMKKRVWMEPELEAFAGEWSASKRIREGAKLIRWGWQLIRTGKIIAADARPPGRRKFLPFFGVRTAALN